MVEMIKFAPIDILERKMVRAGGGFTPELNTRIVNHGYFTQLENLSLQFLGMVTKHSSDL